MKTADIPDSIEDMAVAGKVVSKRTARAFVEYGMEKETSEHYTTKLQVSTKHAETRPEGTQNMASTTSVIGPAAAAMDGAITHGGSSNSNYRRASTTAASADMDLSDVLGVPRGGASEMGSGDIEPANHTQDSTTTVSRSESPQEDGRPINFGLVLPGIYRSSYPQTRDYPFLESLHLNTVV
jgi:tyrosine-protein phosphatase SIW14